MPKTGGTITDETAELGLRLLAERRFDAALEQLDTALASKPGDVRLLNARGRALNNLRRHAEAAETFARVVELDPGFAEGHNNLGHVLRAVGDLGGAERAFRSALEADPGYVGAYRNLATVYAACKDYQRAAECLEKTLELDPRDVVTYASLAEVLQFLERYDEAVAIYDRGLRIDESSVDLHVGRAALKHSRGRIEEAMRSYRTALELDPDNEDALAGRALLEEIMGDVGTGWDLLEDRIRTGTGHPGLLHAAGRLLRRLGRHGEALALILPLCERRDTFQSRNPELYFTLGEIYDELGQYDEAFAAFRRANDLKHAQYDPASDRRQTNRVIGFFTAERLRSLPRAEPGVGQPVFIVGMPRSGTSLIEQILASHSRVHAGGERDELPLLIRHLNGTDPGYPECLDALTPEAVRRMRDNYLDGYGEVAADTPVFTDKRPWNFHHIGLIELLFPNARIVHCTRTPADTALSIYFQNLNARTEPYASNLSHIAAYYRGYLEVMTHWRRSSGLAMLELRYEDIIDDQERETRRLLEFLDLDFEPRCLKFHETKRIVNTASYAQVRKPIYRSSVARYRNYERHLDELGDLLG